MYVSWVNEEPYFWVQKNNVRYIIRLSEFLYAESYNRVLRIHRTDSSVLEIPQKPIDYIIGQARSNVLVRCGRGILINRRYIDMVDITNKKLLMSDGTWLKIGMSYVESIKALKNIGNDV